jgi:cation/acetate symporter
MVGATYVQIVKAVLVWSAAALLLFMSLMYFSFDLGAMFTKAKASSLHPDHYLIPGAYLKNPLDTVSLAIALALGTAGLPHVMTRFYTVPSAVAARHSAKVALVVMTSFAIMVCLLGFAASAIVGPQSILQSNKSGNSAITLLAVTLGGGSGSFGGEILLACVSAIAFATILAVVSGIMISSASTIAHDIFAMLVFRTDTQDRRQVKVAKVATVTFGILAIVLALAVKSLNVAFLVGLAFAIAASANLPVILMTLYWHRFTGAGAVATVIVGVVSSIGLVLVGPAVVGPHGLVLKAMTPLISLANPGIISIPCGFFAGWLVSIATSQKESANSFEEQQLRMLSGYGAEEAVQH